MYLVETLYKCHGKRLGLELVTGGNGLRRKIKVPEAHRPGLNLSGDLKKNYAHKGIEVFGGEEIEYLRQFDSKVRVERLEAILSKNTPTAIVARNLQPPRELCALCEHFSIPLFRTHMPTMNLLSKLIVLLSEEFSASTSLHGTLVEVFGVGILIQGKSSVGKSEAALGLIERGHRLISDDIVQIKRCQGNYLEGYGADLTRYQMEIRGIGIINIAHLYGAVCVRDHNSVDLIVELQVWDESNCYDLVGLDEKYSEILGIQLPFHILPIKPGRDVVLLLETIALNHRLKQMGHHSAKEFNSKLLELLSSRSQLKNHNKFGV